MRSVTNAYDKARSACEVRYIIDAFLQLRFITTVSLKFQSGSHFLSRMRRECTRHCLNEK